MTAFTLTKEFHLMECGECGINFYTPEHWWDARANRGDHGGEFCCPNGHTRIFSEPEIDRIRKQLVRERAEHDQTKAKNQELQREMEKRERKLKRVSCGVCPQCNRSFTDLRRHMDTKHKRTKNASAQAGHQAS